MWWRSSRSSSSWKGRSINWTELATDGGANA
jgi:hypothetical protein